MKIALLGYGRMGKAIEQIAIERGHTIVAKIDKTKNQGNLSQADVAINFSVPDAAVANIKAAMEKQIPVVCGTTGWLEHLKEVEAYCTQHKSAFIYASNFSVGVNLFFNLNTILAKLMHPHKSYTSQMKEIHHIHKLDAPSGTAITLAEGVFEESKYTDWSIDETKGDTILPITVERTEEVPGTHSIEYKSVVDSISIQHEAHSRQGFALGAVIASEWIQEKKGIFTMSDVLNIN